MNGHGDVRREWFEKDYYQVLGVARNADAIGSEVEAFDHPFGKIDVNFRGCEVEALLAGSENARGA